MVGSRWYYNNGEELNRITGGYVKNFYFAVSVSENGKNYAYIIKATENDNILSKLNVKNIVVANICETKKRAAEVVSFWNISYKINGTHMFDSPSF